MTAPSLYRKLQQPNTLRYSLPVMLRLGGMDAGVFLYYVAFAFYSLGTLLPFTAAARSGIDFVDPLSSGLKLLSLVLLALKLLAFQRYSNRQFGIVFLLGLFGFLSYVSTGSEILLSLILFVIAARDTELRVLAALALLVNVFVFVVAFVGYSSGILENFTLDRNGSVGVRGSYGFRSPNYIGLTISSACVALFVLRDKKIGLPEVLIMLFCSHVIIELADSRTGALGLFLGFIIFFLRAKLNDNITRRGYIIGLSVLSVFVIVLSVFFMCSYDSSQDFQAKLNTLLSTRLYFSNWYYENYPPGLLGQDVSFLPVISIYHGNATTTFIVDNSFARLYLNYGVVAFLIVAIALSLFFFKSFKCGACTLVLAGIAFAVIYGFSERYFLLAGFNYFFLIGVSWLIYGFPIKEKPVENKKNSERRS